MRPGKRDRGNKEKELTKCRTDLWSINLSVIRKYSSSRCTLYVLLQGAHAKGKKPNFNNICISMNVK